MSDQEGEEFMSFQGRSDQEEGEFRPLPKRSDKEGGLGLSRKE